MANSPVFNLEEILDIEALYASLPKIVGNFAKLDAAAVKSVNGQTPDDAGNVVVVGEGSGAVDSVNGRTGDVMGLAEGSALAAEVTLARANEALKMAKAANGSDIPDPATFRSNLGLGDAATKNTGTSSGQVMAGNDSRVVGAAQKSANLSDLGNPTTALNNLGGARLIELVTSASPSGSYSFPDVANGTVKIVNLSSSLTSITLPTPGAGKSFLAIYKQDASGNRAITHTNTNPVRFPGGTTLTLSTGANAIDIVSYICWDGSTWDCLSGVVTIDSVKLFPEENFASGGFAALPLWRCNETNVSNGSGNLKLMYVTARRTELISNLKVRLGATAFTSPTLLRLGIYTVAANGDLTLVAASASNITGATAASTYLSRALASPYTVNYGERYALAFLGVAGSSASFTGAFLGDAGECAESGTRIAGNVGSQTDLPSTITAGTVTNTTNLIQIKATP